MRVRVLVLGMTVVWAGLACRSEQTSAPPVLGVTASVAANPLLHVTPDGATQGTGWFGAGSQVFNVVYDYNPFTSPLTLNFICLSEGNAKCGTLDHTSATLAPGQSMQVRADFTTEMPASGRIILSAEKPVFISSETQDQGDVTLNIQRPTAPPGDLQITPIGDQKTVYVNSSGTYTFQVSYPMQPFAPTKTAGLTCRSTGGVTCTSLAPSVVTLNPGQSQTISAAYTSAAAGSGYVVVARLGIAGIVDYGGDVKFTIVAPPPPLSAWIAGPNQVQKGAICTWTANVSGGTPPYRYAWVWAGAPAGSSASVSFKVAISGVLRVTVTDVSPQPQTTQATLSVQVASVSGCTNGGVN